MNLRNLVLMMLVVTLGLLGACSKIQRPVQPLPQLNIGVASFTQPTGTLELLAGYIPEQQGKINEEDINKIDSDLKAALAKTSRSYTFIESIPATKSLTGRNSKSDNALKHWVEVGKKQGVDVLIVPMIIDWQERDGGKAGVTSPAAVMSDFFMVDVRGEGNLLQRSHYKEKQAGLASNILNAGTFFERGGKWVTAQELTNEAIAKAVREFGL